MSCRWGKRANKHDSLAIEKKEIIINFKPLNPAEKKHHLAQCIQDSGGQHEGKDKLVPLKQAPLDVGIDLIGEVVDDAGNPFGRDCRLFAAVY